MITREMIRNGFESGTVSIEEEYAGCIGILLITYLYMRMTHYSMVLHIEKSWM